VDVPASFAARVLRCYLPFAAGYFLSYAFRVVNGAIAPDMTRDLALDPASLGAVTSAYFAAFALAQLPIGVALDRWGPRRVETFLLIFAAAGAMVFAAADGIAQLALGRALIGFGVAACLIAAIKANTLYWPMDRLPLANGTLLGFGGLGAGAATLPVELVLATAGWRFVLGAMACVTLVVAATIWFAAPRGNPAGSSGEGLREQARGMAGVLSHPAFWRVAPMTAVTHAVYLSYQSLWAGPWMRDVAGLERLAVAEGLFLVTSSMAIGYPLFGVIADRLAARGISPRHLFAGFAAIFMAAQIPIALGAAVHPHLLWTAFGLAGCGNILGYAVATQSFPTALAGRVNAAVNVLTFALAFVVQWGIGAALARYGGDQTTGHAHVLLALLAAQAACWIWLVWPRRERAGLASGG
jgi:predicted MFS family arabinose efflux permease